MPVIVHSQRPLLHTFLPLFSHFFPHLTLTHIAVNGTERLRLMCTHLSFVIRLPIATEADPFDTETPKVEFSCNVSLPACRGKRGENKQNMPRAKTNWIQILYKGTPAESHTLTHFNFFCYCADWQTKKCSVFPFSSGSSHQKATALKQNKRLAEEKKKSSASDKWL